VVAMRRLLWAAVVATILLSAVVYAATYSASVCTYNVTGSYNIQQKSSLLVDIEYSLGYLISYVAKESALRNVDYDVICSYSYVFHEPSNSWIDCSFPYRKPYLFYYDGSLTGAYVMFTNDTDVFSNFTSYGGLIVAVDSDVVPFDYEIKESSGLIKVGIKPSSFGGTGDYVMIKVNGSWIHPVEGSVESGTSGKIINASFSLDPNYVWVIEAVGMHHTGSGWSDPTYVYIWDSNGNLLHSYKATSHTWKDSIYGSSYFEYVNIDNYQVPKEAISGSPNLYIYINLSSVSAGYHYLYIYYGGSDTSYRSVGVVADAPLQHLGDAGVQNSSDYCLATTTTTTTTSGFYNWYGGGGGAPVSSSDESSSGLVTNSDTVTETRSPIPFPNVMTEVQKVSNWIVSRSGRSALLLFGLLVVLGLILLSSGSRKGKRRVRGGGRRRR